MSLKEYYGKNVSIIGLREQRYIGRVTDYVFPEDNENGLESIIVDLPNGEIQEFYQSDITEIKTT